MLTRLFNALQAVETDLRFHWRKRIRPLTLALALDTVAAAVSSLLADPKEGIMLAKCAVTFLTTSARCAEDYGDYAFAETVRGMIRTYRPALEACEGSYT